MLCSKCQGTGQYMGNGMIYLDCDCDEPIKELRVIDRKSKAYREAILNIMKETESTREQAIKVFESEFDKIA